MWLWLAFGLVVWNVIFDYQIKIATDTYVYEQASGKEHPVHMEQMMWGATVRGVKVASFWTVVIMAIGFALLTYSSSTGRSRN